MKTPPRSRVVNFRVTEQEFEEVKSSCALSGRPCISEYAREAVLEFSRSQRFVRGAVERRLLNVDDKLTRVLDLLERTSEPGVAKHDPGV